MVYGLISQLDDATTQAVFRSKRIASENIYYRPQLSELFSRVKTGDAIYCISINRFSSVNQLWSVGKICMERGVSLRFIAQPYLDLGNGKHWKPSVVKQIQSMVEVERRAKAHLTEGFRMTREQWDYLYTTLEIMNLEVLAHTFSADGILKRGS